MWKDSISKTYPNELNTPLIWFCTYSIIVLHCASHGKLHPSLFRSSGMPHAALCTVISYSSFVEGSIYINLLILGSVICTADITRHSYGTRGCIISILTRNYRWFLWEPDTWWRSISSCLQGKIWACLAFINKYIHHKSGQNTLCSAWKQYDVTAKWLTSIQ